MRNFLLFAVKLAISLTLLYVALGFVNFSALRDRFDRLDYAWLAAVLIVLALQILIVSVRWKTIATYCGAQISNARAIHFMFVAMFFNQVLPSTVGGDAARIWLLGRDSGAWKSAIYSVLIDRAAGLVWLAVLVLACLPWSLDLIQNPIGRAALVCIGAAGVAAPFALYVLSQIASTSFAKWKSVRHLAEISASAWRALTTARIGAAVAIMSIVLQLMNVAIIWFCARSIGSPFTLWQALLLVPPVTLIAAIPISIAGWGVREGAMIAAFTYAGLPESDGLLVSILFGATTFIIGALGGIVWILSANRMRLSSLHKAREMAADL